jgi:putative ABC transport system substrate-binding protein
MNRRRFIATVGSAIAAPLVRAQAPAGTRTLGILSLDPAPTPEQLAKGPLKGQLAKLGWQEGQNLVVERRFAAGSQQILAEHATDLVRKRVDVIWTGSPDAALAAARATQTIPIVFWAVAFPVEQGLIDSLPRPGRNVTGIAFYTGIEVSIKLFEFLREIAPHARRVFTFVLPTVFRTVAGGDFTPKTTEDARSAAQSMGYEIHRHVIEKPQDLEAAFAAVLASRAEAVNVPANPLTWPSMGKIVEFLNNNGLASAFNARAFVQAGGLFSYGPNFAATWQTSFVYVDKILRGAKPSDLPVEQPSRYELAVNLRTAKHLGLKVPGSMLVRAEHVFE